MKIKFHTFEKFHNKKNVGSTRIRVHNLIERWEEASLYRFGDKADVMVFQKIYCSPDYKVPATFDAIRILDICDPDWFDNAYIKETIDGVHAVVTSTPRLAEFVRQMTDKPVKVIRDRFVLDQFPEQMNHNGEAKKIVWFGYQHNAEVLRFAIPTVNKMGFDLTIISDSDPRIEKWADDDEFDYNFIKYDQDTIYGDLQKHDICLLPKGARPEDPFKSENKTVIAQLCGLPVATDKDSLERFLDPKERNMYNTEQYSKVRKAYNVERSVDEYKELIQQLQGS